MNSNIYNMTSPMVFQKIQTLLPQSDQTVVQPFTLPVCIPLVPGIPVPVKTGVPTGSVGSSLLSPDLKNRIMTVGAVNETATGVPIGGVGNIVLSSGDSSQMITVGPVNETAIGFPIGGVGSSVLSPGDSSQLMTVGGVHETATGVPIDGGGSSVLSSSDSNQLITVGAENEPSALDTLDSNANLVTDDFQVSSEHGESEDGLLSIKIDSVFSLSTKENDADVEITVKEEPKDPLVDSSDTDSSPEIKTETTEDKCAERDEPDTITVHPCFVVLEQLSQEQISNSKGCSFKCSSYCRTRTLNFLCDLSLLKCASETHALFTYKSSSEAVERGDKKNISKVLDLKNDTTQSECLEKPEVPNTKVQDDSIKEKVDKVMALATQNEKFPRITKLVGDRASLVASLLAQRKSEGKTIPDLLRLVKGANPVLPNLKGSVQPKTMPANLNTSGTSDLQSGCKPSFPSNSVSDGSGLVDRPKQQTTSKSSFTIPLTMVRDRSNKRYCMFKLNGKNVLVPTSDDITKPITISMKDTVDKTKSHIITINPNLTKASSTVNPSNIKLPVSSCKPDQTNPNLVPGPVSTRPNSSCGLPTGLRIKPEPVTLGYGDEKPQPKSSSSGVSSKVKVKEEPQAGWQEIWCSESKPLPTETQSSKRKRKSNPKTLPKKLPKLSKETPPSTVLHAEPPKLVKMCGPEDETFDAASNLDPSKVDSASVDTSGFPLTPTDDGPTELTRTCRPDSGDMAKCETLNAPSKSDLPEKDTEKEKPVDRIERLKAMLREKQTMIEHLKKKRQELPIHEDDT